VETHIARVNAARRLNFKVDLSRRNESAKFGSDQLATDQRPIISDVVCNLNVACSSERININARMLMRIRLFSRLVKACWRNHAPYLCIRECASGSFQQLKITWTSSKARNFINAFSRALARRRATQSRRLLFSLSLSLSLCFFVSLLPLCSSFFLFSAPSLARPRHFFLSV